MHCVLKRLLLLSISILFLAACSNTSSTPDGVGYSDFEPYYVASVEIDESSSQAELEAL